MDKVVVIGGAGFMGSHTADELSNRGFEVTIFDLKKSPWLRDDQHTVVGNMLDVDAVSKAVEGAKYLYHFGGIADIGEAARTSVIKQYSKEIMVEKTLKVLNSVV